MKTETDLKERKLLHFDKVIANEEKALLIYEDQQNEADYERAGYRKEEDYE